MSSKSILILGAGFLQKPAIESAKSLGYKVYVIDANPEAVCVPLADEFRKIDLKDREGIAEYAMELKQNAGLVSVFTAATDFSASVSYACEKAGIDAHSFKAALNATDKPLMRQCFTDGKVPSPEFSRINRSEICEILNQDFVSKINYPCVVKPVDNMGARGCRMIREKSELLFSVEEAVKNSRSGNCILEEYMAGPEFSIDALVYNGTMTITGFADRHIFYPPYFIEMGHTMPTNIDIDKYYELVKAFAEGVHSLGLTRGAAKADIKYTEKGPMIGEIAARLSGGYMSGWTFPYSSEFNLTEAAIQISAGEVPQKLEECRRALPIHSSFKLYQIDSKKVSAERAWISIPGKVKKIHGLDQKVNSEIVKDIFPRVKEGDKVTFPRNNVEKCGNVISVSESREKAISACENVIKNIVIELEKDNTDTQMFLEGKKYHHENGFPPSAFNFSQSLLDELFEEIEKKDVMIPENINIKNYIPDTLNKPEVLSLKDWNYLSLQETLDKFNEIKKDRKKIPYKKFWTYVVYGGIQGALYAVE